LTELAREERDLWGSTYEPGYVDVFVETTAQPVALDNWTYHDKLRDRFGSDYMEAARYVLFPLQKPRRGGEGDGDGPGSGVMENILFTLQVRYPAMEGDPIGKNVRAALQAWVRYGGIGARTRRGCGALYSEAFSPKNITEATSFAKEPSPSKREDNGWPIQGTKALLNSAELAPERAWLSTVRLYREFRQGGTGRNPGSGGRPGRSRWPEADSLRNWRGGDPNHKPSITVADGDEAFPRARLGLPILMHFKDYSDQVLNSRIKPVGGERFASPLILKPLPYGDGSRAAGMVASLAQRMPEHLEVAFSQNDREPISEAFTLGADLATYPNSPMSGRSAKGDAVEAFLAFAKAQGYK